MSRKKNTSLLYDPELSMSEDQHRREINEINKEIGGIWVEELPTPITRYTRRDSSIASTRRTDERPIQRISLRLIHRKMKAMFILIWVHGLKPQLTESLTAWTVRRKTMISELEIDTCLKERSCKTSKIRAL